MKIYDMHIHAETGRPVPRELLARMAEAGIWGGAVFSPPPLEYSPRGAGYEERVAAVLDWCGEHPGRLFPVLWMHPDEPDALACAKDAAVRGVAGFKIICNSFYVGDDRSMELISAMAALRKPVSFHSGILWDGANSSRYNRPANWEAMLDIPGLKFSLAHCSWPWYDECIAVYGKIQNAYSCRPEASCEMFFDLTPGTPPIYRRDLLTKLFTVGYDVRDNILFGMDNTANHYNAPYAKKWMDTDNALYDELGVDGETRAKVYGGNYLRFIGEDKCVKTHAVLVPDHSGDAR